MKPWPLAVALLAGCATTLDLEAGDVTLQRPTVGRTAYTTPDETIQVEAGVDYDPGDTLSTPAIVRWGRTEAQELYAGWDVYQWSDDDGSGTGDVIAGFRERVIDEDEDTPAVAWEAEVKLPTGRVSPGLSSGELDFFAGTNATKRLPGWLVNGYYRIGFLGEVDDSGVDLQHTLSFEGRALDVEGFVPFAELAGIFEPETGRDEVFTTFGSYIPYAGFVFDVGAVVGFTSDAPDFALVFGLTRRIGKAVGLREYRSGTR